MAATEFGTNLEVGAGTPPITLPNAANYIVESYEVNGTVDMEVTNDADGAPYHINVYNKFPTCTLNLICLAAAAPTTDFPEGQLINTNWYIDSAPVVKTKSPHRVTLQVTQIGIT